MKTLLLIGIFIITFLCLPNGAFAGDSYRCGNSLVTTNDTIAEVIAKCGPPFDHRVSSQEVSGTYGGVSSGYRQGYRTYQGTYTGVVKNIDALTYNCGEGTIIHILTFRDGKLQEIRTGGRGSGENHCK